MYTLQDSIKSRSASALAILAALVLMLSVSAQASDRPLHGRDREKDKGNDRQISTTTQTQSGNRNETHSSTTRERSWRQDTNNNQRINAPVKITAPPVATTPATVYRPDNGGNRIVRTDNVKHDYKPPSEPVFRSNGGSFDNHSPTTTYKPNNNQIVFRNDKNNDLPKVIHTDTNRTWDNKPNDGYKPDNNPPKPNVTHIDTNRATDYKPIGTYRPNDSQQSVYHIDNNKISDNRFKDGQKNTYKPDNNRFDNNFDKNRGNKFQNRNDKGHLRLPDSDKFYKPSGPRVIYKPAVDTSYRKRVGIDYYRPHADYRNNNWTWDNIRPKNYRPPVHKKGYYYYNHDRDFNRIRHRSYDRPHYFGFWLFNMFANFGCRSVYYHYGYYPYIQVTRVYQTYYPEVIYVGSPVYTSGSYYLEDDRNRGMSLALGDIRSAWISGRYDLIVEHVMPNDKLAIFLDGRYDYSIDGSDYLAMTRDALEDMQTASFTWDRVRQRDDGTYTAFATHRYYSPTGDIKTIYVSFTLDKIGSRYYIVEVGSSMDRLY